MITSIVLFVLFLVWYFILRPRSSGKTNEPIMITSTRSKYKNVPIIGHIIEFFQSPNTMVQRCYDQYGPIFTIPVRTTLPTSRTLFLSFGSLYTS